jgi:uncharacterized protein YigA (DUF484 family)
MSQSENKKEIKNTPDLSEEQVKRYLEDNRDFFDRHADLVGIFEFSHARGQTASIFEKQVSVLREKNVEFQHLPIMQKRMMRFLKTLEILFFQY